MIQRWHEVPVPYITAWSNEIDAAEEHATLLTVRTGIAHGVFGPYIRSDLVYIGERPSDRDAHGLLWNRMPDEPGTGRPLFGAVHPTRQRTCMLSGACQICAGPGSVWMTPTDRWTAHVRNYGPEAPFTTSDPPVCRSCTELAVRHCPKLTEEGWVLLAADQWAPTAVRGLKADADTATFPPEESGSRYRASPRHQTRQRFACSLRWFSWPPSGGLPSLPNPQTLLVSAPTSLPFTPDRRAGNA
ncbi:hypothetical protein GCM10029978_066810 [Actinoallomurus acanthiterrae]